MVVVLACEEKKVAIPARRSVDTTITINSSIREKPACLFMGNLTASLAWLRCFMTLPQGFDETVIFDCICFRLILRPPDPAALTTIHIYSIGLFTIYLKPT
jgi:hypothetical protein